jgi:hypothetical protein
VFPSQAKAFLPLQDILKLNLQALSRQAAVLVKNLMALVQTNNDLLHYIFRFIDIAQGLERVPKP